MIKKGEDEIIYEYLLVKGTVSRDWIGQCKVLIDFLMASSFFYSNKIVLPTGLQKTDGLAHNWQLAHAKFACDWRHIIMM
jgi:hypothetical protein